MFNFADTTITTGGTFITDNTGGNHAQMQFSIPSTSVSPIITTTGNDANLIVKGDADFEGDLKIKGKSILETLEAIENRLAILQPDPKKLAKYEALKKAYDHYKLMEKLIGEDE